LVVPVLVGAVRFSVGFWGEGGFHIPQNQRAPYAEGVDS